MSGAFGSTTVQASAALATANVLTRQHDVVAARRATPPATGARATALTVPTTGSTTVSVDDAAAVDFLATPSPNPFRGLATIRFGLARAGEVRLELFDVAGRRIQTLVSGVLGAGSARRHLERPRSARQPRQERRLLRAAHDAIEAAPRAGDRTEVGRSHHGHRTTQGSERSLGCRRRGCDGRS